MIVKNNYLFPDILKLEMHVISQDMGEFFIASNF